MLLQGTLAMPPDSQAAYTVVSQVRAAAHAVPGADAKVGGATAINADVEHYAIRDRNVIIPLVLLVVLIILAVLLQAVVAPLILIGTVILSFGAALGLSVLAFRYLFGFGGADNSMPLFAFVFLVALGIDYNIFLMTRVREESLKSGTHRGMLAGLAATGGVITAEAWSWRARSPRWPRCPWSSSRRSGSQWRWASCWTRWWCGRSW